VNATQFQNIIARKDSLEESELMQIKLLQEKFPYFQIPHFLVARHEYLNNLTEKSASLGLAAINSPDRIYLKSLIEAPKNIIKTETFEKPTPQAPFVPPIPEKSISVETTPKPSLKTLAEELKKKKLDVVEPAPTRKKLPADDLIETIRKKEKKPIQDSKMKEQIDLIKEFSKKDIKLATLKEIEGNQNPQNLAESSTKFHDNLLSESYARLLSLQGKKKLALEIYKKLILKFPDKRTYFEELIEKLKD
jgi:hypothetical protein